MVQHKTSVIESFATKLACEPRLAVLLSDVLLHGAGLDLLGAVRARQLLRVPVHPLSVIVEAAGKFERHPTLVTVGGPSTRSLLSSFHNSNIVCVKLVIHGCKVWKLG